MKISTFEAAATLVGCIIGAGILGIPYVVAKAGFVTGIVTIISLGLFVLVLNLYAGEIALRTKENHQVPGYAGKYLGEKGKHLMTIAMVCSTYGAMLAYIIKTGQFLTMLFGGTDFVNSIIFFSVVSFLVYLGIKMFEKSEIIMVAIFIIMVAGIFVLSIAKAKPENFTAFDPMRLFLPYGVVLFAFMGLTAVPEIKRVISSNEHSLKKALILGSLIPIVVYLIFTISVVAVAGKNTTEAAVESIKMFVGPTAGIFAAVFAVLAMATCFLGLGLALRQMYIYDYKMDKLFSWFLSCFVPLGIFLFVKDFISVLSATGAYADGLMGIIIVLTYIRAKKEGDRKPEYSLKYPIIISYILIAVMVFGMIYELLSGIGLIAV